MPAMPTGTETAPPPGSGPGGPPSAGPPPSPAARRLAAPRWLDLRLVVGVILVVVPVAVGARVVAASGDTVAVLVAAEDLAPGQQLTAELVEEVQVRLGENLGRYVTGDVGDGYVVVRPVGRGELLPRAAVAETTETEALRYVTLPLPGTEAPAGLAVGDLVDVWRVPGGDGDEVVRLLPDASVVAVSSGSGGLADVASQVRVTVAVVEEDGNLDEVTAELVGAARAGLVYLTRQPAAPR